ncbi:MAG: hypothetical protein Fur0023_03850 [Bacteroidia bacterium]
MSKLGNKKFVFSGMPALPLYVKFTTMKTIRQTLMHLALTMGMGGLLQAQITLEHTYPPYVIIGGDTCYAYSQSYPSFNDYYRYDYYPLGAFNLSGGTTKYYALYTGTNRYLRTYNLNHSIDKTINMTNNYNYNTCFNPNTPPNLICASVWSGNLLYLSDKLFDNDNDLEFILYSHWVGASGDPRAALLLYDETTNNVTVLDSGQTYYTGMGGSSPINGIFANIVRDAKLLNTSGGWKLVSYVDSFYIDNTSYPPVKIASIQKIYSLPGNYPPQPVMVKDHYAGPELQNPYPNPTDRQITLPYQLPAGQTGTLNIYNTEGKLIKSYTIDATFKDIILNASELPKGMYLYTVECNGQKLGSKKFVVQ